MTLQHGYSLPTNPGTGNRGNHTVEALPAAADDAALAAYAVAYSLGASDRGRVVFQTGGDLPGWHWFDGAGGWIRFAPGAAPPVWAHSYWDPSTMVFDGSDELTAWLAANGDNDDLAGAVGTLAAPPIATTANATVLASAGYTAQQAVLTSTAALEATLSTAIGATEDLYAACYSHIASASGATFDTDGGVGVGRNSGSSVRLGYNTLLSGDQSTTVTVGTRFVETPRFWEVLHKVDEYVDLFADGVHLARVVADVGERTASVTDIRLAQAYNSTFATSVRALPFAGFIIHNAIPTAAQRRSAALWLSGGA